MRIVTAVLVCAVAATAASPAFADVTATLARQGKLQIVPADDAGGGRVWLTKNLAGDVVVTGFGGALVNEQASQTFAGVKSLKYTGGACQIWGLTLDRCDLQGDVTLTDCDIGTVAARGGPFLVDHCAIDACRVTDVRVAAIDSFNQSGGAVTGGSQIGSLSVTQASGSSNTTVLTIGRLSLARTSILGKVRLSGAYGRWDSLQNISFGGPALIEYAADYGYGAIQCSFADRIEVRPWAPKPQTEFQFKVEHCTFSDRVTASRTLMAQDCSFTGRVTVRSAGAWAGAWASKCTFAGQFDFRGGPRPEQVQFLDCTLAAAVVVNGGPGKDSIDGTGSTFAAKPKLISVEGWMGLPPAAKREVAGSIEGSTR